MARYEHLPIYAKAYQLAVYVEQQVHGFPRFHKYAIGADLRVASTSTLLTGDLNNEQDRQGTHQKPPASLR